MNIEVKKSIEIEDVLGGLKNTMEYGSKEINREMLEDTIHVIEVLVKKNKQLRDINKNLKEKLERRNKTISDLTSQVGKLNHEIFEMQSEGPGECKCCCEEDSDEDKEPTVQDVLKELEVLNELVVISKLLGIL